MYIMVQGPISVVNDIFENKFTSDFKISVSALSVITLVETNVRKNFLHRAEFHQVLCMCLACANKWDKGTISDQSA